MLCGNLSFAVMSLLIHLAGRRCDWRLIALARTGICLTLTLAWTWQAEVRLVVFRPATLWLRSVAGSISLLCTFCALTRLPVSDVLTLSYMFPIWVALLSWPVLGQLPPASVWLSVASGVAGVCLIEQPHIAAGNFASLLALASSFCTAVAMIGLHRLREIDPRAIVVHFSSVSMLCCLGVLAGTGGVHGSLNAVTVDDLLLLGGVGLTATAGQIWLTKAFAAGRPTRVAVVGLTQVVFAMLLELVVLGRSFDGWTLIGMALVLIPTAVTIVRSSSR